VTTLGIDGGGALTVDGQLEATLDVETVAGLAPGANVVVYATPDLNDQSLMDAVNQIVSDGVATVASLSLAGCEAPWVQSVWAPVFQAGTNAGITFVASSGDQGNECWATTYQPGVNYPASDPNVVGAGGNESQFNLASPVAWNDHLSTSGDQTATGGGVSSVFVLPPYQNGIATVASSQFRNVPDIALPAVSGAIYESGAWHGVLGTSWSAPAAAAMLAEIEEYCRAPLGNANALLYAAFNAAPSADFIDVTSGNNQFAGTAPYYTAAAGYDNATGLGMPLGTPLTQTLCANHALAMHRRATAVQSGRRPAQAYTVDLRPNVRGLRDAGRRAGSAATRIALVLRPESASATAAASDEAEVVAALRAAGLTIVRTFRNHLVVDAEGPSGAIERLFGTTLDDFAQPLHGTVYATVQPATVPASLAPYLNGLILDNVVTFHHAGEAIHGRP
jgi:hypothetical protein